MNDDIITGIKLCDDIADLLVKLKDCTSGLKDLSTTQHPVTEAGVILFGCRHALLASYGKAMYEAPDGAVDADEWLKWIEDRATRSVDKLYSEDDISTMSKGILSSIRRSTREEGEGEGTEDGVSVQ